MSAAALLLASALLLGGGGSRPRSRIRRATPERARRRRLPADPFAAASAFDVFAVCLSAGMPVAAAAAATVSSAPAPLGAVLKRAGDLLALGADPEAAWSVRVDDQDCEALMRLARHSATSGSALARGVGELAEQSRQNVIHTSAAAAERAGVLIAGPLGLCFLPAFVLLGIVPVVAGLAGEVFSAGIL